ncbi:MAG TPA: ImmA/IrrE family metallo-endopeptidase [Pyrinomonadaceae bacterium]|nr:ImmA/IrrE family metallo-endopeptidase [Pyrinomonadaceae bacterium]
MSSRSREVDFNLQTELAMQTSIVAQFGYLDHPTYIRQRVKEITRSFRVSSDQLGKIPFDPFKCAESLGIVVRYVYLPRGISGQLRRDLAPPVIEVECEHNQVRKRYTVCHELAHLCFLKRSPALPSERGEINQIPKVQKREERLCDRIAAELLMPETAFLRHARVISPSFDAITSLAQTFDVSISATLIRLRECRAWSLGVLDCELDACRRTVRRRTAWLTVSRSIRHRQDRSKVSMEIDRTLEAVQHYICKEGVYINTGPKLRFKDFNIHFLRTDSGTKIKAVALKQS